MPGFELVADEMDLHDHVADADLVITGEGRLDATSFAGKVVGGVVDLASEEDVPVAVIVGSYDEDVPEVRDLAVVSLVDRFGETLALAEPKACIERAAAELLERYRR